MWHWITYQSKWMGQKHMMALLVNYPEYSMWYLYWLYIVWWELVIPSLA